MCWPRRGAGSKEEATPQTPLRSSNSDHHKKNANENKPIYLTETVPNETKKEQVQHRLTPVLKTLFDVDVTSKTGGSSGLLAEKLAQKNQWDEAKDVAEQTCEDDCNYHLIRKDMLAMVEKSHASRDRRRDDTMYEGRKKPSGNAKEQKKKTSGVKYRKDSRQSKSIEDAKPKSIEKVEPKSVEPVHDAEMEVTEKNFMYNVKEIDYCLHDILRCIEEDNLYKNINSDSGLPEKVEPYGDLEPLTNRSFTTCKVLRRNTLISVLSSFPSADEMEEAAIATAKHMSEHSPIRFLPVTTLQAHCEDMREDQTNIDASDIITAGTAIAPTATAHTAFTARQIGSMGASSKKTSKKRQTSGDGESEKKTAEEI